MKKLFLLLSTSIFILIFSDCTIDDSDDNAETLIKAKGDRYYGGVFRLNESEYFKNLFPHNITDAYSYRIACQIYEGLFKFDDETLKVIPALAESYDIRQNGTVYSIKLKEGIYFHDDPCFDGGKGREVTAEDVKYCFTRLCTQNINNQLFSSIFKDILKGANEYYNATEDGRTANFSVSGIKVVDKYSLELTLLEPNSIFLVNLSMPGCFIYPREAEEKYGLEMRIKAIGTGPFLLSDIDEDISIILKKNPRYHGADEYGNQLPFLDALSIQFIKDKKTELFEFKKRNLDMIYRLPTDYILEILEESQANNQGEYLEYELQRVPEMATQFLTFNLQNSIFRDINVRKAFSYAIDREKILDFVLNGEGYAPGIHGITPPVLTEYDIDDIDGYTLNVDSARYFLNRAGYRDGKKFPKIELFLNPEGERNTNVAIEIQKQLKDHLNVNIELTILPFAQLIEKSYQGNFGLMRAGWVADFPSVENFLWIFYGDNVPNNKERISYPNIARYKNSTFDRYFSEALNASSIEEANLLFKKAEKILISDAPIIVLWYDEGYRLIQSYVKNFPNNPMQYRDFSEVCFKKPKQLN
jgi:peptide/nickel transport system substrate-binding protein